MFPDVANHRLIDSKTNSYDPGFVKPAPKSYFSISSLVPNSTIAKILSDFPEAVGLEQQTKSTITDVYHHIITKDPPVAERPRRLSPEKLKVAKADFQRLVELGICRPSSSHRASPIHLAARKGGWRICGDYTTLNSITVPDKYPVPNIQHFSANLFGKKIFSRIDLRKAYQQIPVVTENIPKTAVITPFGLFEYLRMTFGFSNAGQTFQRYIYRALGDLSFVFAYIDDIMIASESAKEHGSHIRIVLQRLKVANLTLNLEKC